MSQHSEPIYDGENRVHDPSSAPPTGPPAAEASVALEPEPCHSDAPGKRQDGGPIEAMLSRLEKRGVHVAESFDLDVCNPQDHEGREDALIKAFHALDVDGAQRLSVQQLRGLVCLDSPEANQQQAGELLHQMDKDKDGLVNMDDWKTSWEGFQQAATDSQFYTVICAITHGLHMPVDYEPGKSHPRHPANNREYCNKHVARLLEHGLAETITFLADLHVQAASKELWEEDGFLPPKFAHPCPVRFLGEWLQRNNPVARCENDDPQQLSWDTGVPWDGLTSRMIFRAAFQHLDRPPSGYVAIADVERLVGRLPGFASPAQLQAALDRMDLENLGDIELEEFQEVMAALAGGADGWSVQDGFRPVLTAYFLSFKDWEGQLRYLFDHLLQICPAQAAVGSETAAAGEPGDCGAPAGDGGAQGGAGAEGGTGVDAVEWAAVMAIARWKLHTHDPDALLGGVDVQHGPRFPAGAASFAPFCDALNLLYANTDAVAAADELAALLDGAVELQPARGLPQALAARVRSHPLYARVPAMPALEVQAALKSEAVSEVIGVDCRTGDEYDVSTALSALLCDMLQNPYTEYGWEADADALQEVQELAQEALDMPTAGRPLLVTFCTDGSRAALVALKLMELLPAARVVNMVGGLLAWRGLGGELEGPDGEPTDELHPFSADLEPFLAPWPLP